jgi:hypothetical protein
VQDNTVDAGSSGGSIGIVISCPQGKSTIQYNTISNSAKYGIAWIGNLFARHDNKGQENTKCRALWNIWYWF